MHTEGFAGTFATDESRKMGEIAKNKATGDNNIATGNPMGAVRGEAFVVASNGDIVGGGGARTRQRLG